MTQPAQSQQAKNQGPEFPSEEKLRIRGDFLFLATRSAHHRKMSVANLGEAFEPPIELGQFNVFRFDGIPRGLITWARLSKDAERRFVSGEGLSAEDWNSGDHLWIIDLIAPYPGLIKGISKWIMQPDNIQDRVFYFRRVINDRATRRIVRVDFDNPASKAKIMTEADFL